MKNILKIVLGVFALFLAVLITLNIYVNKIYKDGSGKATVSFEELTELSKTVKSDRINVLLVGVDNLSADDNFANMRTDTIMLLSVDPKSKTGFILSIPRDTRVEMDKYKGKINSAYSVAGINFTIKTVKELLGIPVHHFVEVDYQALFKTINDVGGVEVNVPMDMVYDDPYANPPLHIDLKQGLQVLDGEKSMQFLRFRHGYADQDLGRIKSQQEFMNALIKKLLSVGSIVNIPSYIDTFYNHIKTDMSVAEIFQIASKGIEIKPHNIKKETLIGLPKMIYGVSYYVVDEEKMKVQISSLLQGNYYTENEISQNAATQITANSPTQNTNATTKTENNKAPSKSTSYVVVLNGVGKQGLAQRAKDLLYVNNIDTQNTANADKFDYKQTYIYYKDNISLAEEVQSILGTGQIVQENKAYYGRATDILVVLGEDFTK